MILTPMQLQVRLDRNEAFRVLDLARGYEAPELDTPEVEELRNVLTLVGE